MSLHHHSSTSLTGIQLNTLRLSPMDNNNQAHKVLHRSKILFEQSHRYRYQLEHLCMKLRSSCRRPNKFQPGKESGKKHRQGSNNPKGMLPICK